MAHAIEVIVVPSINTLMTKTGRAPNRSIHQPTAGDRTNAASAPALTEPLIRVRLQPNSSDSGSMKMVRVVMFGAMRANTAVPDAATTTHP